MIGRIDGNYTCIVKLAAVEISSEQFTLKFLSKRYYISFVLPDYNINDDISNITKIQYLFWQLVGNETSYSNKDLLLEIDDPIQGVNNVTLQFYIHMNFRVRMKRNILNNLLPQVIKDLSNALKQTVENLQLSKAVVLNVNSVKGSEYCTEETLKHPLTSETVTFPKTFGGFTTNSNENCPLGVPYATRNCVSTTWQQPIWKVANKCFIFCPKQTLTYQSVNYEFPSTLAGKTSESNQKCSTGIELGTAICSSKGEWSSVQPTKEADCFFFCDEYKTTHPLSKQEVSFPKTKFGSNVTSLTKCPKSGKYYGELQCRNKTKTDTLNVIWTKDEECLNICPLSYAFNKKTSQNITFPKAVAGQKVKSLENCSIDIPIAIRECSIAGWGNIYWSPDEDCGYITIQLRNLSRTNVTNENVEIITRETRNITETTNLSGNQIELVTNIIQNVKESKIKTTQDVFQNIINIASNVLRTPLKTLVNSQNKAGTSSNLVQSVDYFSEKVVLPNKTSNLTIVSKRISVAILEGFQINNVFSFENIDRYDKILTNSTLEISQVESKNDLKDDLNYGIYFADNLNRSSNKRVIVAIYSTPKFFERSENIETESKVISASVIGSQTFVNLTNAINLIFQPENETIYKSYECVFWNFKSDNWSSEGCKFSEIKNGRVFCECDHFTNFAILFDPETREHGPEFLSYISKIGLAISLVGYIGVIVSFIVVE